MIMIWSLLPLIIFLTTSVAEEISTRAVHDEIECGCLAYECTVTGSGLIDWRAHGQSACICNILLQPIAHPNSIGLYRMCSGTSGAVIGHIIGVIHNNNTYTTITQLIIKSSIIMENTISSITCDYDDGFTTYNVGNFSVPRNASLPSALVIPSSPNDTHLAYISPDRLSFEWTSNLGCPAIHYEINATGCGNCPNTTYNNSATCSISAEEILCSFAVRVVVCYNTRSNLSNSVQLILRVPGPVTVKTIPTYLLNISQCQTQGLSQLRTTFTEMGFVQIPHLTNVYTINYSETISGSLCLSDTVFAASCKNNYCEHSLNFSNSSCPSSSNITVTVSGKNALGSGPTSEPIMTESPKDFVEVLLDQNYQETLRFTCKFLKWQQGIISNCSIIYGSHHGCCDSAILDDFVNSEIVSQSSTDTVVIDIPTQNLPQDTYCFIVTASCGAFIGMVKGMFNITATKISLVNSYTAAITTSVIILFGIMVLLGLAIAYFIKLKHLTCAERYTANREQLKTAMIVAVPRDQHEKCSPSDHSVHEIIMYGNEDAQNTSHPLTNPNDNIQNLIYADLGSSTRATGTNALRPLDDDRVLYAQIEHQSVGDEISLHDQPRTDPDVDENVNLDNLLIHLRDEVTPKWHELGEIIGVPKESLDKYSEHPPDQCIIEVLDYWLMLYHDKLTWKDVARALKELNLHQLSEKVLQIHENRLKNEAKEEDHHFQQNSQVASSVSLSNIEDAESRDDKFPAADQKDIVEGTLPPPLPLKCSYRAYK